MGFKHTGLFPEQAVNWDYTREIIRKAGRPVKVLNLFAYTGGASLAAAAAGADVTHVDSVRQVVTWARENMEQSNLGGIRWVVEDALKFVRREVKRGHYYDGIILDPPAYGRGPDGEKWVLEQNIGEMLDCCSQLLDKQGGFAVLNLYSMGLSAMLARSAMCQLFPKASSEQFGELYFTDRFEKSLPLGVYYRATYGK
jgi:23S rRNA (cytosine1962-C5)-methyltransferase